MLKKVFAGVLIWSAVFNAQAVIIAGGDGTGNTTEVGAGGGWDYVGRIDKAGVYSSVTYVSNNWFVTAHHIKVLDTPTGVLLGGSSHSIDASSWTRLTNSASGDADLSMFQVTGGTVGLSGLTVRSSATSNGSGLTLIGNGLNRATTETTWNAAWVEGGVPTAYTGYKWAGGATKRWGTNSKLDDEGLVDDGYGITDMFVTDFSDIGGNEAHGARYDSGGGVFYDAGSEWELAGIMLAAPGFAGQPANTAVYGNKTYIADMQYYADQINTTTAIPEPSVLILGVVFSGTIFFIRRVFLIG